MFWCVIHAVLNYFCLQWVEQGMQMGTGVSGAQDVLFINWAVMALAIFTDKAPWLFITIPAYLLYTYGGMIKSYLFPPAPIEAPMTEADLKRQAKKERQAGRVKYARG